jgi:hypothetical protein
VGVERIAMSTKETLRGTVLAQVQSGAVSLMLAAAQLAVSYRHAKRLYRRYKAAGRVGLRHGHVGRRSNRAWPSAERDVVLALIRAHYGGGVSGPGQRFGPTLAAEHLWTDHGHLVPVPTLRRWMTAAGLWSRARRARPVHVRRLRRAAFGEMLQLDGSFHDWFEGRGLNGAAPGARPCLMSLIDDATSTTLARFAPEETTWAAVAVLEAWIREYGVPQALYTDAKTVYVRAPTSLELATGVPARTQFGQMCARLGIALITARSPQAKGRIERNHGTNQDRLVKELRLAGIATIEAANAFLSDPYLPRHNARFAQPAAAGLNVHTPMPRGLSDIFALEDTRRLGNDWVVRYDNRALQVTPTRAAQRHVAPGRRVFVRETAAGVVRIVVRDPASGREYELPWTLTALTTRSGRTSQSTSQSTTTPITATVAVVAPAPAGYTRQGKPLSAKQVAMRAHWDAQTTAEIERRRTWARVNAERATPAHE